MPTAKRAKQGTTVTTTHRQTKTTPNAPDACQNCRTRAQQGRSGSGIQTGWITVPAETRAELGKMREWNPKKTLFK